MRHTLGYKTIAPLTGEIAVTDGTQSMTVVEGMVYDNRNNPLSAVMQLVIDATGVAITDWIEIPGGGYTVWTDKNPYTISVVFRSPGFQDRKIQIARLDENPNVILQPGQSNNLPIVAILVVVSAIAIYRKQSKKVGAIGMDDMLPIFLLVAGVIGFSVFKQIMEFFGFWKSQDTKDLDNLSDNPNSFWNPNYWQTVKPSSANWSYAITDTTAIEWCREIYNSFGMFNDNEERVIGVFKRCRTRANASFLAYIFDQLYSEDLLTFLRGGNWPQDRLSDSDVNTINKYINNLPKY